MGYVRVAVVVSRAAGVGASGGCRGGSLAFADSRVLDRTVDSHQGFSERDSGIYMFDQWLGRRLRGSRERESGKYSPNEHRENISVHS